MTQKHRIVFNEVSSPIAGFVTKFGGQPNWLAEPQWPLSRETGNPMRFICQIRLNEVFAESKSEMAYLFMTEEDDDEFVDGTHDPDGGENAVILQPGTIAIPTSILAEGPTLYRMVQQPDQYLLQPEPCEFAVTLITEDKDAEATGETVEECKIGGAPVFMQNDEFPFAGTNHLLLQLDSCSVPFYINFGDAGVGYAFLNEAGDQAKFLWQCG